MLQRHLEPFDLTSRGEGLARTKLVAASLATPAEVRAVAFPSCRGQRPPLLYSVNCSGGERKSRCRRGPAADRPGVAPSSGFRRIPREPGCRPVRYVN